MSLSTLVMLFIIALFAWLFWLSRGIAEAAKSHVERYCQHNELQLISVSRNRLRLAMVQGKPGWRSEFNFEFSGNREDRYSGTLIMLNDMAKHIEVPPYRTSYSE